MPYNFGGLIKTSIITTDTSAHTLIAAPGVGYTIRLHVITLSGASTTGLIGCSGGYIGHMIGSTQTIVYDGLLVGDNQSAFVVSGAAGSTQWSVAYDIIQTPTIV